MTSFRKPIILNVDDSAAGRYAKTRILERAGYRVLEAATGAAALQRVAETAPELVLLDIKLPDLDGIEVCRAIKGNPATAHTMVLQISAIRVSAADRIESLEGGADAFLSEPVEAEELIATARALLRLHERERENRRLIAELAASDAQFRAFFESTSVGTCQADPVSGRLLAVNRCFCEIVGYGNEELLGRPLTEIIHAEDRAENQREFLALSRGEVREYHGEKRLVRKDGAIVWADVTANLVRDAAGNALRAIAVVHDISERKAAETAQR